LTSFPPSFSNTAAKTIDLSDNHISHLAQLDEKRSSISSMTQLVALDLSSNELNSVAGLNSTQLQMLNVSSNRLSRLASEFCDHVPLLEELYLGENELHLVEGLHCTQLKILNLSNNQLSQLASDSFEHVPLLEELYLKYNGLTGLKADQFSGLSQVRTLHLSHNQVSNINNLRLFKDMTGLHGARFSAEIYTRGCHSIPRMFA
jgi:Leucine-rich repeat (LRR) protein